MGSSQKEMKNKKTKKKRNAPNVTMAKLAEFTTQRVTNIVVNKPVKNKILAKKINVHIEHSKSSKRGDSFLKPVKETDQKKKEVKRKVFGFNLTTSLPHPEEYIL